MAEKPGSDYEWRRKRGRLNRFLEKVEGLPADLLVAVDWAASSGGRFS
ncbi:MAG: hypothetical protein ACXWZW_04195 [Solirubrobacterales bacterium]